MAAPSRRPDAPLEQSLFREPYRFEFFQAVRLLERLAPGREPVGRSGPPGREVARFRAHLSLAFPASEVQRLGRPEGSDGPPELTESFLGLIGPLGVLPQCYTELLIERVRAGDRTLSAFLDLFHHRLLSLFYRAWERHRPALCHDRPEGERFLRHLLSMSGLGTAGLRDRGAFPDAAVAFYSGLFARRRRPAVALESMLREYFGLRVEARQFVGHWLRLGPDDRSTLGASGRHNGLGIGAILGAKVWDEQGKFRLRLGPLTFEQFLAYSPDGPSLRDLAQMARLFVGGELDFDVQLVLKADEVPESRLTSAPGEGARLGRHAWLRSRPFSSDAEDAIFAAGA